MRRADAGFTLVELLVATAITAVLAPSLTAAMVLGWRTSDDTVTRLGQNRDRHLLSSLFTRDVQSATDVATSGAACLKVTDTLVVRLTLAEPQNGTATPATRTVTYALDGTGLLERRSCPSGVTIAASVTTAHAVVGSPVVRCRLTSGGAVQGSCGSTSRVVELVVTDAAGAYTSTGRRRS